MKMKHLMIALACISGFTHANTLSCKKPIETSITSSDTHCIYNGTSMKEAFNTYVSLNQTNFHHLKTLPTNNMTKTIKRRTDEEGAYKIEVKWLGQNKVRVSETELVVVDGQVRGEMSGADAILEKVGSKIKIKVDNWAQ